MIGIRRIILAVSLGGAVLSVAACDPNAVSTGGSIYYDSMLWNDYYYDRPGYRPPNPPGKPVHPIEPGHPKPPPGTRPPGHRPPVARPPVARPPIHRPSPRRR